MHYADVFSECYCFNMAAMLLQYKIDLISLDRILMLRKEEQILLAWKTAFLSLTWRGQASEIFCEENEWLGKLEKKSYNGCSKRSFWDGWKHKWKFEEKSVFSFVLFCFSLAKIKIKLAVQKWCVKYWRVEWVIFISLHFSLASDLQTPTLTHHLYFEKLLLVHISRCMEQSQRPHPLTPNFIFHPKNSNYHPWM